MNDTVTVRVALHRGNGSSSARGQAWLVSFSSEKKAPK